MYFCGPVFAVPVADSPEKFRILALEEKRILERAIRDYDARVLELERDLLELNQQQEWSTLRKERIQDQKDMTPYELGKHIEHNATKINAASKEKERLEALIARHVEQLEMLNGEVKKRFGDKPLDWWTLDPGVAAMMTQEKPAPVTHHTSAKAADKKDLGQQLREKGLDEWLKFQEEKGGTLLKSIKPILFASGKTEVQPGYDPFLKNLAEFVTPLYGRIQLEGYTDSSRIKTKDFPSNWELAAKRASSVAGRLMSFGVPASTITVISRGSGGAPMPNDSTTNRALNRQVDITVFVPDVMEK
ncbi:MAG: OmpA family protein [Deltaproteobacteria bacterium]|nr:OmpA family protein [Deltaproteobacteria bacterium]